MATEAQRRASRSWNNSHREKIREYERNRYNTDEEYRERIKQSRREYYRGLPDDVKIERSRKNNQRAKDRYRHDSEYREKMKQKALARYYRVKEANAKEDTDV
jgi:hypothetical protein